MPLLMEKNEPAYPKPIGLLGANGEMLERMTSRNCSRSFNLALGTNLSIVVFARFNRTTETGKNTRLDKAKMEIYGQKHEP